ncbi:hypothetical protein [Aeromonas sobria]|uniref:hypothetical protein n=1 Tax=Aeromonas sobria TaxID=646 RepID=UPI0011DF4910|nr:hypothetical protein [Aeromonas sobria]
MNNWIELIMASTVEILNCFGEIHKKLDNLNFSENNTASGNLLMTADVLSLLNRAIKADLIPSQTVYFNKNHIDISEYGERLVLQNAYVEIIVSVPPHTYRAWDEFLGKESNRIMVPKHFLIIEDDYSIYSAHSKNKLITSYKTVIELIGFLRDAADHENNVSSFVYLGNSKLTIDISYDKKGLEAMNTSGFEVFTETMLDKEHARQKKYILQEVLFNMLLQTPESDRFTSLLRRLQDFVMQCEHGYRLFVTSFSFDSVRREYEEKYREYNFKLNSSISDVATKSLATPITMLFSISNISSSSTSVGNFAVAVSSMLVSIFIIFLVRSNADTLDAIKNEYTVIFDRLLCELVAGSDINAGRKSDVELLKNKLDSRVSTSENLNKLTVISAIASSIFVVIYLLWISCTK